MTQPNVTPQEFKYLKDQVTSFIHSLILSIFRS